MMENIKLWAFTPNWWIKPFWC